MASLSNSLVISKRPSLDFSSGSSLKSADQCVGPANLAFSFKGTRKSSAQRRPLIVQASYRDGGRSDATIFVGGFVIGGLIAGTLGCVYAPQISKAIAGTDRKELMKKLPKFIYDEEKALAKQRRKLAEKIHQINAAIDTISHQLQAEQRPRKKAAMSADGMDAVV